MNKEVLQNYLSQGLSSYKIAKLENKVPSTIRYWMNKFELEKVQLPQNLKYCPMCDTTKETTEFYNRRKGIGNSPYCKPCHHTQTLDRQRLIKKQCVEYLGGKCVKCGYDKCFGALHAHHLDPTIKDINYNNFKLRKFDDKFKEELDKCILLCANCHAEEHTLYCN